MKLLSLLALISLACAQFYSTVSIPVLSLKHIKATKGTPLILKSRPNAGGAYKGQVSRLHQVRAFLGTGGSGVQVRAPIDCWNPQRVAFRAITASSSNPDFAELFDTSLINFPAIYLFEDGKYEIYSGSTTTHSIKAFISTYSGKLTKSIPSAGHFFMPLWSQMSKYVKPLTPFTDLLEIGEGLQVVLGLVVVLLPLVVLGCFLWEGGEEADEAEKQAEFEADKRVEEGDGEDVKLVRKHTRQKSAAYAKEKPEMRTRRTHTKGY